VVGQIAKIKGCRAVGIAGSVAKCRYAVDELGFDACINRRAPDFVEALARACPSGVDIYFENVGGAVLRAVWPLLNNFGRVPSAASSRSTTIQRPPPDPASYPYSLIASPYGASSSPIIRSDRRTSCATFRPGFAPGASNTARTSSTVWNERPKPSSACCRAAISAS